MREKRKRNILPIKSSTRHPSIYDTFCTCACSVLQSLQSSPSSFVIPSHLSLPSFSESTPPFLIYIYYCAHAPTTPLKDKRKDQKGGWFWPGISRTPDSSHGSLSKPTISNSRTCRQIIMNPSLSEKVGPYGNSTDFTMDLSNHSIPQAWRINGASSALISDF